MALPWLEIALVLAAGFIPVFSTPLVAMLIVASILRWLAGSSWGKGKGGQSIAASMGEGVLGLVLGVVAFAVVSLIAGISTVGELAMVRGNEEALVYVAVRVAVLAVAAEMIFRGFIMSRLATLTDSWGTANVLSAIAFGIVIGGRDVGAVAGVTVAGLGYGCLYLASKQRLALPIGAHVGFAVSAVAAAYFTSRSRLLLAAGACC